MRQRPLIALVVDHPKRDLPGLVLVGSRLVAGGADVALIPLNLLAAEVFSLAPDFVVFNYLRRNLGPVLRGCTAAGIPFALLDTEGGLYGDLNAYTATFIEDRSVLDETAVVCAWGRKTADHLIATHQFRRGQVTVTGVPRFDFYHPDWRGFFESPTDGRDLILVNTKVAVANPQAHSVEDEIRLYVDVLGLPMDEVLRHRDIGAETIEATTALVNRLGAELPDARFVVRPHPHERLETYTERLDRSLSNVEARSEGTVDRWIVQSKALIHRQCTTAIEAGLAGVPALVPQWVPSSADAPDTEAVSISCTTHGELREYVEAARRGEDISPGHVKTSLDRIVDDWFHAVDGQSHRRVAEVLLERVPSRSTPRHATLRGYFYRQYERTLSRKGLAGRAGRVIAGMGLGHASARIVHPHGHGWEASPKSFTLGDVRKTLASIRRVDGGRSGLGAAAVAARDAGLYRFRYPGRAILLSPSTEE